MIKTEIIILAGGRGVRMNSSKPKSLQKVGGKPMLHYILSTASSIETDRIHVVYGASGENILEHFSQEEVNWVLQSESLGTGHAALQAISHVNSNSIVCILYGDVPFLPSQTITKLAELAEPGRLALLTTEMEDPAGYGRIKRSENGKLESIVEEKDASKSERQIKEVNAGPLAAPASLLSGWLARLNNNNQQREYYLTDIVEFAVSDGIDVATWQTQHSCETTGVNSRLEQSQVERAVQLNNAKTLMQSGIEIIDPARFDLRGDCIAGKDCRIDVNVVLEGKVEFGNDVNIEANNVIRDSVVDDDVTIHPNCVIEGAQIGAGCTIGPFARIRPGAVIGNNCRIGNFVEIKNSTLGEGSKVNHLAYVGDSTIGKRVNIGAGAITCNYDGKYKHRTIIGNNVFIGSNVALVAPVEIGDDAVIAAGSTITKNVDSGHLAIERSKTKTIRKNQLEPGDE